MAASRSPPRSRWCRIWPRSASAPATPRRTSPRRRAAPMATTSRITTRSAPSSAARTRWQDCTAALREHRPRPRRGLRAQPHGDRHRTQRALERRARERSELAGGGVLRHRVGARKPRSCAPSCCCRSSAISTAACSSAASCKVAFRDGQLTLTYFETELPINPRQSPRVFRLALEPLDRDPRRRQPGAARVPEHHHLAAEAAAVHRAAARADGRAPA